MLRVRLLVFALLASVEIRHTAISDSIRYAGSQNMKFTDEDGVKLIHLFYNRWVDELRRTINAVFLGL